MWLVSDRLWLPASRPFVRSFILHLLLSFLVVVIVAIVGRTDTVGVVKTTAKTGDLVIVLRGPEGSSRAGRTKPPGQELRYQVESHPDARWVECN